MKARQSNLNTGARMLTYGSPPESTQKRVLRCGFNITGVFADGCCAGYQMSHPIFTRNSKPDATHLISGASSENNGISGTRF